MFTGDSHGNMLTMPGFTGMQWDYADRLKSPKQSSNGRIYYSYDAGGNRVRKYIPKPSGYYDEWIYFGNFEIYRRYGQGTLRVEKFTYHIMDDTKRVALLETKTIDNGHRVANPVTAVRYQYDNHLGSACLELDENAGIVSYEEFHPFGTTSYRSGRSETEVSLKRYKYVGKERDEETGLYYYGMRYYADWLCRFVSVDPLQFKYPELTPFQYASNRPVSGIDLDGAEYYTIHIQVVDNAGGIIESVENHTNMNESEIEQVHKTSANEFYSENSASYGALGKGVLYVYNYYEKGEYVGTSTKFDLTQETFSTKLGRHGIYYGPGCITYLGPWFTNVRQDVPEMFDFSKKPIDLVDYYAQTLDYDYFAEANEGYQGFIEDTRTYNADIKLVNSWKAYLRESSNDNFIDPFTNRKRSDEAVEAAKGGILFIGALARYKEWKISEMEKLGLNSNNPDDMQDSRVTFNNYQAKWYEFRKRFEIELIKRSR